MVAVVLSKEARERKTMKINLRLMDIFFIERIIVDF